MGSEGSHSVYGHGSHWLKVETFETSAPYLRKHFACLKCAKTYKRSKGHVGEDDDDGDDHGHGDPVRRHVVLLADLLVNQAPLVLLSQRPRGDLGVEPLAAEPPAAAPRRRKKERCLFRQRRDTTQNMGLLQ